MTGKIRIRVERLDSYNVLDSTEALVELQTVEEARDAFNGLREIVHDPAVIAEAVFKFAKSRITSKWWECTVNMETMRCYLEGGRFGEGVITEIEGDA